MDDLTWIEGHRIGRRLGLALNVAAHTDDATRYRDALRLLGWARALLEGPALEGLEDGLAWAREPSTPTERLEVAGPPPHTR